MPQFSAGEQKTAIIPMANPTGKPFDYSVELYMGTNLTLMTSADFHLEAGELKNISLLVTMPSVVGTYPVYIGAFSEGENIPPIYQVEDIVIVSVAPSTVRLYGTITDSLTGVGINGVELKIWEFYGTPIPMVYTDSLGNYSADLIPSKYMVRVYKSGYQVKFIPTGVYYDYLSDTELNISLQPL